MPLPCFDNFIFVLLILFNIIYVVFAITPSYEKISASAGSVFLSAMAERMGLTEQIKAAIKLKKRGKHYICLVLFFTNM